MGWVRKCPAGPWDFINIRTWHLLKTTATRRQLINLVPQKCGRRTSQCCTYSLRLCSNTAGQAFWVRNGFRFPVPTPPSGLFPACLPPLLLSRLTSKCLKVPEVQFLPSPDSPSTSQVNFQELNFSLLLHKHEISWGSSEGGLCNERRQLSHP